MKTSLATTALNFQLDTAGDLPEWLLLIPAGAFSGRDGRTWHNSQPDQVIAAFVAGQRDIVVDIEHASELKAPKGEPAPAQAWVKALQNRNGEIWGRVEYTESGRLLIASGQYRYYSPAFHFDANGLIWAMASVGLTNKHNLFLPALNQQGDAAMKLALAIALALGLNHETATEEDAVAAITRLKGERDTALNSEKVPSLDKYVPRADYDAKCQIALNAEQKLADYQKADQDKAITAEVDAAVAAGKITPATREFYLATCRQEGGLERFKTFVAGAPVIAPASGLDDKQPGTLPTALNAEEAAIAAMFGNTAEDIAKFGQ